MKSNRLITYTLAAVAGLMLAAQSSFAQGGGGGGRGGGRGLGPDATEEQTAAYTAMNEETRDAQQKVTAAQTELNNAIYAEKADEAAIKAKAGALAKVQEEFALARAKAFAKVRSKFTPDQIERMKAPAGGRAGGQRRGGGQ